MFRDERITGSIPAGWTVDQIIGQMVVEHAIHPAAIPAIRVSIWTADGVETVVPFDQWRYVRPKTGASVRIHVVPMGGGGGGGGKSPIKLVAVLAVMVAAAYFAPMVVGELAGAANAGSLGFASAAEVAAATGMTKFGAAIAIGAVGIGISMVGNAIVNAIIPTGSAANRDTGLTSYGSSVSTPTYAVTGVRNRANPFGVVPKVYGRRRVYPVLAANTYTESQGDEQYFRALFCFGYGPLQIEDIRIGETSIDDFIGVEYETRQGFDNDSPLTLFTRSVAEDTLSVALTQAGSWATRTTRANTDEISVDVSLPRGLTKFESGGGRSERSVSLSVEYSPAGAASWVSAGTISLTDNTTSTLRGSLRWTVTSGQYDVRIKRDTADSTDDTVMDKTYWSSLRSITTDYPINMPGLALLAIRIKATEQLNGAIDTLNAVCTSMLPIWDGTSWSAPTATRNPAWAWCDVLRGSANSVITDDDDIDLAGILEWANACDTTSPQGEGPMWQYDAVHDKATTVDQMLRDIAAAGRARYIRRDGKESVLRDVQQVTAWQHFTPRNSWGFRSTKTFTNHPHALKCRFINPDQGWQEDEVIVYSDGYNADGSGGLTAASLFEQIDMMHCTEQRRAWREGRYHMAAARLRPAMYELTTDVENLACQPGDLVYVAYDVPQWGQWQSRIQSLTSNMSGETLTITLDSTVTMEVGKTYVVRIRRTVDNSSVLAAVNTVAGESSTLTFTTPITVVDAPSVDDLVLFGESGEESVRCIVKSIRRGDNLSATISLVDEAPYVHTSYTGAIPTFVSNITQPAPVETQAPPLPTISEVYEDEVIIRGSVVSRTYVKVVTPVSATTPAIGLQVQYRVQNAASWVVVSNTALTQDTVIDDMVSGQTYDIRVRSVAANGQVSAWRNTSFTSVGVAVPPEDVSGFSITVLDTTAYLSWLPVGDADLSHYVIKWSEDLIGATWSSAQVLVPRIDATSINVPALVGTYLIKAVDYSGSQSVNEVSVTNAISGILNMNVIATVTEDPSFSGTKTDVIVVDGALELESLLTVDDIADVDAVTNWDLLGNGYKSTGTYYFANDLDLGAVYTSRLTASVSVSGINRSTNVDSWLNIDDVADWDGVGASDWGIELQVRTTNDNPAGSPTWSDWQTFIVGDYSARAFEWRIVLSTLVQGITPSVSALSVNIDMPDRLASDNDVVCPNTGLTVTFSPAFRAVPAIAIADQNMATGDYKTISSTSSSGFNIQYFNSGGSPVQRTFDWVARGYGYAV
jgi:predicted phage tail protein